MKPQSFQTTFCHRPAPLLVSASFAHAIEGSFSSSSSSAIGLRSLSRALQQPFSQHQQQRVSSTSALTTASVVLQVRYMGMGIGIGRPITTTTNTKRIDTMTNAAMASDDDYMAFLNKANEGVSSATTTATTTWPKGRGKKLFKTRDADLEVDFALQGVANRDEIYVSEADEAFEVVGLRWKDSGFGLPEEEEFARLIEHGSPSSAEIEIMDPVEWDPQGRYKHIVEAVTRAGKGNDARVYRVKGEGARVEYWVITRKDGEGEGTALVGLKALAVES